MDDQRGLIIEPKNYLNEQVIVDAKTGASETECVLLIQRNDQKGKENEYLLGTVFLHSYY